MSKTFLHRLELGKEVVPSCAMCGVEARQARRYLEGVANDGVNNIPLRQRLAERGGYCPRHCQQLASLTHLLSAAILFDAFLRQRLARAEKGRRPLTVRCEACDTEGQTRKALQQGVKQHRNDPDLHKALLETPLCVAHLELVCRQLPAAVREQLISRHAPLQEQLSELIRKHDYRFTDEQISSEESASVKRALELLGAHERLESE